MADDAVPVRRSSRRDATAASARANGSSSSNPAAAADERDANALPLPAADADASATAEPPSSTRRSRRQVKSTYATHALASPVTTAPAAALSSATSSRERRATAAASADASELSGEPADTAGAASAGASSSKRKRPSSASSKQSLHSADIGGSSAAQPDAPEPVLVVVPLQAQPTAAVLPDTSSDAAVSAPTSPTATATGSTAAPSSAARRRRPQVGRQMSGSSAVAGTAAPGTLGASSASAGAPLTTVTPMGDAGVSARTQARKVLGRYTARECTLLCEAILQQIKRSSVAPSVLDSAVSPAHIRWDKIALKMLKTHRLAISPRAAQELWKFLAYAEQPPVRSRASEPPSDDDETALLAASDSEDFATSVDAVNAKYVASRTAADKTAPLSGASTSPPPPPPVPEPAAVAKTADATPVPSTETLPIETPPAAAASASTSEPPEAASESKSSPLKAAVSASPTSTASPFRLYPVYDLPTGLPAHWRKPFDVHSMLPLAFAAEKFLRKKPGAPDDPTLTAPRALDESGAVTAAGAAPDAAPKKKRGRKPKAESDAAAKKKPRATPRTPTAARTPRGPYVPSKTPPPQPMLPRAALQFFSRLYEEDPVAATGASASNGNVSSTATALVPAPVAAPTPASVPTTAVPAPATTSAAPVAPEAPASAPATTPVAPAAPAALNASAPSTAAAPVAPAAGAPAVPAPRIKTYAEMQALFMSAPSHVRAACQKLALEDLDRYNRECVRRRIWDKAMARHNAGLKAAPAVAAKAPQLPVPPAQPAVSAPGNTPSISTASASDATKGAAQASGPTPE